MKIYVDGAAWGNPGPAGIGGVLYKDGQEIKCFSEYLGEATNNEAEYKALIFVLKQVQPHPSEAIEIYSDSELLVRQLTSTYRVKSANLKPLYEEVKILLSRFPSAKITHISRNQNMEADRLANQAIEKHHPHLASGIRHPAVISFLSDFGYADGWVGICKGVIKSINPQVEIIDISHDIPDFDIKKGAFVLAQAVSFVKAQVYLAVVDPGVGGARRPIVVEAAQGSFLVGPDNGLLIPATEHLGGIRKVVEIRNKKFMLEEVSPTFHGRDIFSPVAAYLLKGTDLTELGPEIKPSTLIKAPWPEPKVKTSWIEAEVIDIDRFGTAHLNATFSHLNQLKIREGEKMKISWEKTSKILPILKTFSDVSEGEPLLLIDSSNYLSVAANKASASQLLGLAISTKVNLSRA